MQRKLTAQGVGGLTIYLPKKWTRKHDLEKGDTVSIEESGPDLVISSTKPTIERITVTLRDPEYLHILLTHIFRKGYDEVTLHGDIPGDLQKHMSYLLGGTVLEQDDEHAIIAFLADMDSEKYDVLLRRVFLIIDQSFEDLETGRLKELMEKRTTLDRCILFCKRMLAKERYHGHPLFHAELLASLMHLEHAQYYCAKWMTEHDTQDDTARDIIPKLRTYFQSLYDAYFKKDVEHLRAIQEKRPHDTIIMDAFSKSKHPQIISYLREMARLTQLAASPVLGILMGDELHIK